MSAPLLTVNILFKMLISALRGLMQPCLGANGEHPKVSISETNMYTWLLFSIVRASDQQCILMFGSAWL